MKQEGLQLYQYQREGVEALKALLRNNFSRSALLADEPGCLSGHTIIRVNRGGNGRKYTLETIYKRFNQLDRKRVNWDTSIPTKVKALCGEEYRLHTVKNVIYSGVKKTIRLTLKSGKELECTPDHEIATPTGFIEAGKLEVGSSVLTNGTAICKLCGQTGNVSIYYRAKFPGVCRKCMYRKLRDKPTYKGGRRIDEDGYVNLSGLYEHHRARKGGNVYEHIIVMEAHLGRPILVTEHVHHINEIKSDNRIENLEVLSVKEHSTRHKKHKHLSTDKHGNEIVWVPKEDTVVGIKDAGEQKVYDIVMDDPHRNFVANGILVHNCGKTSQALTAAVEMGARTMLIVCPASLRVNWSREVAMWTQFPEDKVRILRASKDAETLTGFESVVIVSYKLASIHYVQQHLLKRNWNFLILDESHTCKNPKSQAARSCLITLWAKSHHHICISGTPVPNGRASEAWSVFSRLDPVTLGAWKPYCSKYCIPEETPWGLTYPRSKNLDELSRIARQNFMVRRTKAVLGDSVPDLQRITLPLDVPTLQIIDFEEEYTVDLRAIKNWIENEAPLKSDAISTARRKLGILKAIPAAKYIHSVLLEEVKNAVVFCHHREVFTAVWDYLAEKGVSIVGINGQTSVDDRQAAIDTFQRGETQVILASLMAAKEGITLTAASTVVFIEYDWTPSVNEQAEGRINRIGQKEKMRAIYLTVADSLDEAIARSVLRKQRDIKKLTAA